MTKHKIDIGDVEYSSLSHVLRFTTACNHQTIQMVEDIVGRKDMTMEEVAVEMRNLLERSLTTAYYRGGFARKKQSG